MKGRVEAEPKSERAKLQRAVAFAEGTIVTTAGADRLSRDAGKLGQRGQEDDGAEPVRGTGAEGQVKSRIGDDVRQLVEQRAQGSLEVVLAGQHAIDGV